MIGGDKSLTELRIEQVTNPTKGSLFLGTTRTMTSLSASIALLIKAGVATDPYVMVATLKTGVVQSLIVAVFILFLTSGAVVVFLHSWSLGEAYTHSELWGWVIHRPTRWIPSLFVAFGYIAALSFCLFDIMDCVPAVCEWVWPDAPAIVGDPWFLQYVVCVIATLPSIWATGLNSFVWIAWVSNFCELVALSCALVYFFRHMFDDGKYVASDEVVLFQMDFESIYCALRDFNICFFIHPMIPFVASEMVNPTRERIMRLTWGTLVIVGAFSYVTPLISYLLFIEGEPESCFFLYLDPVGSPEVIVGAIAVTIIAICSNMYFAYVSSYSVVSIFGVGIHDKEGHLARTLGSLVSLFIAIAMNFAGDLAFLMFYELSSLAYTLLGYFLPALYFLIQFKVKIVEWGILALFVFAGGAFLTILGIMETVTSALAL
jgi:hypothetical protein